MDKENIECQGKGKEKYLIFAVKTDLSCLAVIINILIQDL